MSLVTTLRLVLPGNPGDKRIAARKLFLMRNVKFDYELSLAKMELQALKVTFEVTENPKVFKIALEDEETQNVKRKCAYFERIDEDFTDYYRILKYNQTPFINQYLTHWIYPYKGKFHPQMIRALLNIIGAREGDTILDPFIGSGTTAVESQLLGVNCIGIDISPVCVLVSKVKTESIDVIPEIENWKDNILLSVSKDCPNLTKLKISLDNKIAEIPNEKVRNFFKVAKLIAHSDESRRRKDFRVSFVNNVRKMYASIKDYEKVVDDLRLRIGNISITHGDARKLNLQEQSVDGIITSPPYSIALDYVANDEHALRALGYNPTKIREEFIGVRGRGDERIWLYNQDMIECLQEMYRVLRDGKYCVIVIGNAKSKGIEIKTTNLIVDYCRKIGFELVDDINKIIFGRFNLMQKEHILLFEKN